MAAVAALLAVVLSACGSSGTGDATASGGKLDPKNPTKVKVVAEWNFYAAHAPVIAAIEHGFFEEEGIEVEFTAPGTPGEQVKYMVAGRSDIALTQPMEVPLSRANGIDVKIVGDLFGSNPTGLMTDPDKSGITKPEELEGKTIGSTNTPDATGSISTMMENLGISDYKEVNVGEGGVPLLEQGRVDAIHALYPGEVILLEKETGKKFPFFEYIDYGVPNYPLLSWISTDKYIEENPEVIKAFLNGTKKGMELMKSDAAAFDETMEYIKKENNVFTSEQHEAIRSVTPQYWDLSEEVKPQVIEEMAEWMQTVKVNGKPWLAESDVEPVAEYVTDEFAPGGSQ
ncbi:MAG: ABC transporter substrate-binding protein [Solirubrobacterales bacterium]